tara:strand:+ start:19318 stop:20499 length:1182 start_codon:yes stop_codon:yes gene_type:complete
MKRHILRYVIAVAILAASSLAYSYGEYYEDYDPALLDEASGANEETMGETQRMLDSRGGKLECIVCHGETDDAYDGVINTWDISEATMDGVLSCSDWQIRGICIWLKCVTVFCTINTNIKMGNYVPELVIQSYDRANGEPWTESQDINQISQADSDSSWVMTIVDWVSEVDLESIGIDSVAGGHPAQGSEHQSRNTQFKLTDAYGNPAITAYNALLASWGLMCKGKALMFYPYFISNLDSIAWRWNLPEVFYPMSWIPLLKTWNLNNGLFNDYGPVYPRTGFMVQQDEMKAAVVDAFKVGHIVTRTGQPHIYFNIAQGSQDGYWGPGPLEKGQPKTGKFQMLYPKTESNCYSFPYSATPSQSRRSEDGSYVWNFWRWYKCCKRQGQTLLFHSG